jgi:hypothetical protein
VSRWTFCSGDQRPIEPKVYHYNLFLVDLVGQSVYLDQSPLLRIPYLGGEGLVLPKENDPRATEVRARQQSSMHADSRGSSNFAIRPLHKWYSCHLFHQTDCRYVDIPIARQLCLLTEKITIG